MRAYKLGGYFTLEFFDREGNSVKRIEIHNTTTNDGLRYITGGGSLTSFKWLALDSSATAATASDSSLVSEITTAGLGRAQATTSQVTTDATNDTYQLEHTFTATNSAVVKGVGVFDTSTASAGTMFARSTFSGGGYSLTNGNTIKITYKIDAD